MLFLKRRKTWGQTSKVILKQTELFIPLHCQKTKTKSEDRNRLLTIYKRKGYEKDDDRPRGNVRDDNEC